MRITIKDVRDRAERINKRHGTTLHIERSYDYYNVYINGGQQVAPAAMTASVAYAIVEAFETGLNEAEAIMASRITVDEEHSSFKGQSSVTLDNLNMPKRKGWTDYPEKN